MACEFLSASRKRAKQGFTSAHAWNRLGEFRDLLPLVLPTDGNLARANEIHLTRGASLWDALIIAACAEVGVDTFYSEDLPGFDDFEGVRVVNRSSSRRERGAEEGRSVRARLAPSPTAGSDLMASALGTSRSADRRSPTASSRLKQPQSALGWSHRSLTL